MELLEPPVRYGVVNKRIYRGGYPILRNFRFLSRLRIKTIISLTPEPPSGDLEIFASSLGATIHHFEIQQNTLLSNAQMKADLIDSLNVSRIIARCTKNIDYYFNFYIIYGIDYY